MLCPVNSTTTTTPVYDLLLELESVLRDAPPSCLTEADLDHLAQLSERATDYAIEELHARIDQESEALRQRFAAMLGTMERHGA